MSEETWSKIKTVHREILDNLDVPDTLVTESELCIRPEHIRRIRILAGLSQREFAESIGVCKSTIGNVEIGCNVSEELRMKVKERFPIQYRQVMFDGDSEGQTGRSDEEAAAPETAEQDKEDNSSRAGNSEVSVVIQSPEGAEITLEEIKVRHMTLKFGVGDIRKVSDNYIRVIYGRLDIDLIIISGDRMYDIRIRYRSVFHGVHPYIT